MVLFVCFSATFRSGYARPHVGFPKNLSTVMRRPVFLNARDVHCFQTRVTSTVVQYNTVQYTMVQYSTIQYSTLQYSTIHYNRIQYKTLQYSTMQYSKLQYSTLQYSAVQYCTVQYCTVQCNTIKYRQYNAAEEAERPPTSFGADEAGGRAQTSQEAA